jgi:hypothetical protein
MHPDEPRRYPHGLLPEFPAQALFPLPPGFPQCEGDSCNGPDPGHPGCNGAPLYGAHIAIMVDGTDCPTGHDSSCLMPAGKLLSRQVVRDIALSIRPVSVTRRSACGVSSCQDAGPPGPGMILMACGVRAGGPR